MSHPVFTVNNNEIIDSGAFRICVRKHANRFILICVVIIGYLISCLCYAAKLIQMTDGNTAYTVPNS